MSKNVKKVLEDAAKFNKAVTFNYISVKGEKSTRTVFPEDFINGSNGEIVIAVDKEINNYRRFLINRIEL